MRERGQIIYSYVNTWDYMSSSHIQMNTRNMSIIGSVNDNRVTTAVKGLIMTTFNTYNKVYMTRV